MKAIITFDDRLTGVEVSVIMEGGFNKESHAHQHANIVLNYLDSLAQRTDEQVKTLTADEVEQKLMEPPMGEKIVGASSLVVSG